MIKIAAASICLASLCSTVCAESEPAPKPDNSKPSVEIISQINPDWELWNTRSYNFGIDKTKVPVPVVFNSQIMTNSTIMVRGQTSVGKRWGYHCFEAYANDDTSRLTMLVNKHIELGKPVAEIYYYAPAYSHGAQAYNWVRIGSDVKEHSFIFSRDRAIFYGSVELENAITLANIGKENLQPAQPKGDDERNSAESAKFIRYTALKNAKDGTLYFDKEKRAVLVKIDGQWCKVAVEPLPNYELTVLAEETAKGKAPEKAAEPKK